jgi:hypothetical protein
MIILPKAPKKYDVRDQNFVRSTLMTVLNDIELRLSRLES